MEKKCDGILDFFRPSTTYDNFDTETKLSDELFCTQRYISVYISIFCTAGIAILLVLTLWVMTFDAIGFFGRLILNYFKPRFFPHLSLISSWSFCKKSTLKHQTCTMHMKIETFVLNLVPIFDFTGCKKKNTFTPWQNYPF